MSDDVSEVVPDQRPAHLPDEVLARLRCPTCHTSMQLNDQGLSCASGHRMPWHDGYLDSSHGAVDPEVHRTAESFGYEWTAFDAIHPEDREFWEVYFADVAPESYRGKVMLDAGCGNGRFSYFTAPHVAALASLDNSDAVQAAVRNLRSFENVAVVRSDIRMPPFADDSFDFVSCLGVLHHLPDPEQGFRSLVRVLAPGGTLLVYVYSRPTGKGPRAAGLAAAAVLRRATVHLPHRLLRLLSAPVALALYLLIVRPGAAGARRGWTRLAQLPLPAYRGKPLRSLWLDTFDRLSAPLEKRYVWVELEPWYLRAGLEVLAVREQAGLFVVARKSDRTARPT